MQSGTPWAAYRYKQNEFYSAGAEGMQSGVCSTKNDENCAEQSSPGKYFGLTKICWHMPKFNFRRSRHVLPIEGNIRIVVCGKRPTNGAEGARYESCPVVEINQGAIDAQGYAPVRPPSGGYCAYRRIAVGLESNYEERMLVVIKKMEIWRCQAIGTRR